jgi:hypothetical protein
MGAIIGSAIALSTVIADSSRQTQGLNDFIAASLTADTGIERGLAVVKNGRRSADLVPTVAAITPGTAISGLTVSGQQTSSDALAWSALLPGESASFDVVKSDTDPSNATQYTIRITGSKVNSSYTNGVGTQSTWSSRAELEVSWVGLDQNGEPLYSGRTTVTNAQLAAPTTAIAARNPIDVNLLSAGFLYDANGQRLTSAIAVNATTGFRIKIKAIDNADISAGTFPISSEASRVNLETDMIKNIRVASTLSFPSRISITSIGTVNQSRSQKQASVLWQLPASAALGYAIFTEGSIIPE